jgi:hypothetical protein
MAKNQTPEQAKQIADFMKLADEMGKKFAATMDRVAEVQEKILAGSVSSREEIAKAVKEVDKETQAKQKSEQVEARRKEITEKIFDLQESSIDQSHNLVKNFDDLLAMDDKKLEAMAQQRDQSMALIAEAEARGIIGEEEADIQRELTNEIYEQGAAMAEIGQEWQQD